MHLILDHVTEFKHVGNTHGSALVEGFACAAVIKLSLTVAGQTGLIGPFIQVIDGSTIKDRSSELDAKLTSCMTQNSLKNLTDVHT